MSDGEAGCLFLAVVGISGFFVFLDQCTGSSHEEVSATQTEDEVRLINEIPIDLYPKDGYNAVNEANSVDSPCYRSFEQIQKYWEYAIKLPDPKFKQFIEHATYSSNGLDGADCLNIEYLYQQSIDREDNIKMNMKVRSIIDAPGDGDER